jgi:diguanylate cyclase (GGDEF)-like protein
VEHLQQALQQTSDRVHRARLRAVLAQVHVWDSFHTQKAWHQVEAIFRELGRSLPRTRIGRVITSLVYFALGLLVAKTGWGFGGARGKDRERTRILTQTLKSAGHVAYWSMQPVFTVLLVLRSLYFAHRLGRSAELVQTYVGSSLVFAAVGRNSSSRRFGDQAVQIADDLQDKALAAYSRMNRSIACNARGECLEGERQMKRVLTDRGRWLDVGEYTQGCTDLSWNLHLRGYPREGLQWVQWGLERERQASPQRGQIFLPTKASACLVMLGRVDEASNHLEYARSIADAAPDDRYRQANYLSHLIFFHLEQRHAGQTLEAVRRYRRLGIAPKRTPFHFRNFFVFQAYAWLLRCEDHGADASSLEGLSQSLEELRVTAYTGHPLFLGHLRVLEAALFRLQGQGALALDKLDEAERLAESHDNAWATFEAKRQRALLCRERGQSRAEGRLAEEAFALALDTESKARARLIRRDFDLGRTSSMSNTPTTHGETTRPPTEARTVHLERHVEALVRVSQVSLSVLDGLQQARAILDEVVSLFGAERAILFLRTQDDQLSLFAARNSAGSDLQDTAGYATRLVEDVYAHEVPRVVGGGDDAARVGSESAIAYDLRSIVAAPLKVRDRLVGVVYLDNRLAKGVFTSDDVEILTAICNHIAVAIETARTAQLEMQYKTEREKRELAETLRALVGQAGPETSERSLVERLVRYAGQLVPAARVAYFRRAEDGWHVEGTTQTELSDLEGSRRSSVLDAMGGDGRRRLLRADTPEFANVPVLGAGCAAWLGAPVLVGDEVSGVLALDTRLPHGLDENHLELTQALADQASVALENARLFARVQQLATHDELTGLRNRRALFDTAWQELRRAKRYGKTLSVVMVDVDHFKQVNDTHGHRVGDEVLREIAERLQECIRDVDVLGRYGGEELLVLAPETTGEEAVRTVAERMRARVAAHPVHSSAGPQSITVSLGVTESAAADEQPEDLFARADSALYRAKHEGRNRVALGPSPPDQAGPATPSEGQN